MQGTVLRPPGAAAAPTDRTAQAVLRKIKISPKKLNVFAKLIRRLHIDDALVQCQVAPNKAAKLCYKVLPGSVLVITTNEHACHNHNGTSSNYSVVDLAFFLALSCILLKAFLTS